MKRDFKKDILLLLIGALLASIPTFISNYMQEKSLLNKMVLEQRISILLEYSKI